MIMTYQIAMAAGRDAADKNMRKNNRKKWNGSDYAIACNLVNELLKKVGN